MTVFATNYNGKAKPDNRFEINNDESMTIPGEARTIKELIERLENGMPLERRAYAYFDVEDLDDINDMFAPSTDLTDLDRNKERLEKALQAYNNAIANRDQAQQDASEEEQEPLPAKSAEEGGEE